MVVLGVQNLAKHFGERVLFEGVTFDVQERDKIGFVGHNGSGKTTLFKMLTGENSITDGLVTASKQTRLGYLAQHAFEREDSTLWEEVESVFAPVMAAERELAAATAALEHRHDAPLIERQHTLREQFEAMGGLYYRARVRSTLLGLGFREEMFAQTVGTLSGGQRSKAAMGRLLLSDSNLLLLDEPTNHLDIASVEWLEEFLRGYAGGAVIISHDRYFLDRVTNKTVEMAGGKLYATNGSYSVHREKREKDKEVAQKHYVTDMREVRRLEESIERLKSFNREKSVRAAESKEKQLEKFRERIDVPEAELGNVRFDFTARTVSGNDVLMAEGLSFGFGEQALFRDTDVFLRRGERVFLLGPNGCGKTTLLRLLIGQLRPWTGLVTRGAKVGIGYYDQTQRGLGEYNSVMEEVWSAYRGLSQTEVRSALAAFLFRGKAVHQLICECSGGERARVLLLKLMLARDNLLILDEPTNHLDIDSREALEEALMSYDGTMCVVSHDRYFINRLATRVVRLTPAGCESFPGNYDVYLEKFKEAEAPVEADTPPERENTYLRQKADAAAARKRQAALRRLEADIEAAEAEAARLLDVLKEEAVASDYARAMEVSGALEAAQGSIERLMGEWELLLAEETRGDA